MFQFSLILFAKRLKEVAKRDYGGIGKLAAKIGHANLSLYTSGAQEPMASTLAKLAYENVDVNYLLTGVVKMGEVKEPGVKYAADIEERLSKLESELEKVKARNYDLVEENKELWEAVKGLGVYNQVLTLLHSKANHHLSNAVDPPV